MLTDGQFLGVREDDDPFIDRLRRDWRDGIFADGPLDPDLVRLTDDVGAYKPNNRHDVAKVEVLLDQAGAYDLTPTEGPTGFFGGSHRRAIMDYQDREGLEVDGWLYPDGETIQSLGAKMAGHPGLPDLKDAAAAEVGLPKWDRSKETKVAVAPLLLAAAPFAAPAAAAAGRYAAPVGKALQRGAAAALGTVVGANAPSSPLTPLPASPATSGGAPQPPRERGNTQPPPAPNSETKARREILSDAFAKELLAPIFAGSRGNPKTERGNDIIAKQCKEIVETEFPHLLDIYDHFAGAHKDGGTQYLPEAYSKAGDSPEKGTKGSSRSDLAMRFTDDHERREIHINTVDTLKDGLTPDARERRNFEKLMHNIGDQAAHTIPKLKEGDDEDEYARMARRRCFEIIQEAEENYLKPRKDGNRQE